MNIEKSERVRVKEEPEGIAVRERQMERMGVQFEIGCSRWALLKRWCLSKTLKEVRELAT